MPAWLTSVVEQLWSFLAVGLAVNALGEASKSIADRFGWRKVRRSDMLKAFVSEPVDKIPTASWYDITLRLHPILAGALFGFLPLPALHVINDMDGFDRVAARVGWFMLAGALNGQLYEAVKFGFEQAKVRVANARLDAATSPPAPPNAPTPTQGAEKAARGSLVAAPGTDEEELGP